jgi:hypothetical protein
MAMRRSTQRTGEWALAALVIIVASLQVTARSEDPNGTALAGVVNVLNGTGGDLSQYRPLSTYLAVGLQHLFQLSAPPFQSIRLVQCLLMFTLAYSYGGELRLNPRLRLVGVGLLAGLVSLQLGLLGPSAFSLDRFNDTIFYLLAAILVLRNHEIWLPALMAVAIANRETAVFMPTLILARYPFNRQLRAYARRPLVIAALGWLVAVIVYLSIHLYYGPHPRTEDSYWGPDMFLRSLGMPGQTAYLMAAVNLLPLLALVVIRDVDPFLRRLFWMVVPLWFAIHIWAARLGEGIMYLAPLALILVPMVLQGMQRRAQAPDVVPAAKPAGSQVA